MPSPISKEVEKIADILYELDKNRLSVEDFALFIKEITKFVKESKDLTAEEAKQIRLAITELKKEAKDIQKNGLSDIRSDVESRLNKAIESFSSIIEKTFSKMSKDHKSSLDFIYDKVSSLKDGEDADEEAVKALVVADLKNDRSFFLPTAVETRNGLEMLEGEDRLDKSAIKGIEEIQDEIKNIKAIRVTGGARGVQLYVDGAKKGMVQYINLVAGTNVTLTYNRANGRNDITISATGGSGAFSILAATGTVDNSNTTFTFASEPTLVVVNGTSYRNGFGVTITGTTATLDNPPGVGGDVYGIG